VEGIEAAPAAAAARLRELGVVAVPRGLRANVAAPAVAAAAASVEGAAVGPVVEVADDLAEAVEVEVAEVAGSLEGFRCRVSGGKK